eukprot:CAMPEP_0167740166 /NCGR_PEP_ID=MMETSP0110_2-20121227/119_1 /TAXON_ID=629695 /ORGANISM="Gymnochlora sp., Strain CCMP2014" /LENGTH=846 /DNA_ID=CAMNT_0007624015 /DNA_START=23 /DNA_END=2563 /DNA_ORIENTATION=+
MRDRVSNDDEGLTTSQGFVIVPRIIKFYKDLFGNIPVENHGESFAEVSDEKSESELAHAIKMLGYDFLVLELMPSHEARFQKIILTNQKTGRGQRIIRSLLLHCHDHALPSNPLTVDSRRLRRHALSTLHNLLFVILHHAVPRARPLDALDLILHNGAAPKFVRRLFRAACNTLREEATCRGAAGWKGVNSALKMLLAMVSAALNLHQNALIELFYTEKVFNVLTALVTTHVHASVLPLPVRVKIMVLLIPLVHFQRYEGQNAGLEVLTKKLSLDQLYTFNCTLSSLYRLAQHLFADLPSTPRAGDSVSKTISDRFRAGMSAFAGLMGQIMSQETAAAPRPPPPLPEALKKTIPKHVRKKSVENWEMTTERCFRKARHSLVDLCLFVLHIMLKDNKRFIIRLAKIKRKAADSKNNSAQSKATKVNGKNQKAQPPPPSVAPTRAAVLVERYMSLMSVLLQQPLGPRALLSLHLCIAVAHQMSQDTPANVLLFAAGPKVTERGLHLMTFRRNAAPAEFANTEYEIKTAPSREGRWSPRYDASSIKVSDGAPPLASSLFSEVVAFIRRQLPAAKRLKEGAANALVVVLDVLYRHFTYHLHTPLEDVSAAAMAQSYLHLGRALIDLIKTLGSLPRLSQPPTKISADTPADPLLQALYQSAHFLHLLLCVRGQVFPGNKKASGPRSRLLFELTRNENELARVRERLKWAPVVQSELTAVASAAESLGKLVDSKEENKDSSVTSSRIGHGLTPEEVRRLVKDKEMHLNIEPLVPSRQVRETAIFDTKTDQRFFNQVVNCIVQDFAMLYLCGEGSASEAMSEEESHWDVARENMKPPPVATENKKTKKSPTMR